MKTSQAEQLLISLQNFSNVKGIVGVRLARNRRMIEDELQEFIAYKNNLFTKYGEEKDGQMVIYRNTENEKKFMEELSPLLDEEVTFNFRTFTDEELESADLTMDQADFIMRYFYESVDDTRQ